MGVIIRTADGQQLKGCTRCGVMKTLDEFYRRHTGKQAGTYHPACIECARRVQREYVRADPQANKERCRSYYATHRDEILATRKVNYRTRKAVMDVDPAVETPAACKQQASHW